METRLKQAVEVIHDSPTKAVLYVTGGASHASSWLLSVPGASATVLECRVPYNRLAFMDVVGYEAAAALKSFSSVHSAQVLARAAYQRAVKLAPPGARVCGIAAACALASLQAKKGDHRAFVATHSNNRVAEYELNLLKGHRSRWEEELLSSRLVLQALLDDCGVSPSQVTKGSFVSNKDADALVLSHQSTMSLVREMLVTGDYLVGPVVYEHPDPVEDLLHGNIRFAEYCNNTLNRDATSATIIFPGSFNPVHHGHKQLMAVAKSMYPDNRAAYEISVTNPDKPALEPEVVRHRIAQFSPEETVLITSAPLFSSKGEFFPNAKFVIGVDTALRIVAPKYYGGEARMIASLIKLKSRGCKFLVAGRLDQRKGDTDSSAFLTLHDVPVPVGLEDMFESIPGNAFRVDVSSSEIRAKENKSR